MRKKIKSNRRIFIAGQLSLLFTSLLLGNATAASLQQISHQDRLQPTWETITYSQLDNLTGEKFWAIGQDRLYLGLTLKSVEKINASPERPKHLARKQGLIVTFTSPHAKKLGFSGQVMLIKNRDLGHAYVFLKAVPTPNDDYIIELILN